MEASRSIPPQIPGYTLIKRLGSGSEADVYLYQQLSPARQVAIKISKNTLDPRAAVRFRSEANFMGQISTHPYILSVYENGVTVNGRGYTVFEYAPGGNYKTLLEHGRLTADQMLTVGIDLASALFTAHRKGIIHRDIKPSNILINAHNMPMLADFGIAGSVYGRPGVGFTIAWAAPEVLAQGGGGNESSDIYSLGATLFAMLIGQSPYEYFYADVLGDSQRQVRAERLKSVILNNPLPKLNRPDVPAEVERVLRKALSRTPEDRYYSALELARDMQRVQQALYGRAAQTTVEGVPDYPQNMYAQTSAFDQSAPIAKQHARWAKPLAVTVAAAGRRGRDGVGVRHRRHAEYGCVLRQQQGAGAEPWRPEPCRGRSRFGDHVGQCAERAGSYGRIHRRRQSAVHMGQSFAEGWRFVRVVAGRRFGNRPERAGHHHGVDEYRNRSGRRRADVRAGESGSRGPADVRESHDRVRGQAVSLRPDAGDMNRYEPIQPGMHAGKQVGACGWMRGQAKFGHNQGRASR